VTHQLASIELNRGEIIVRNTISGMILLLGKIELVVALILVLIQPVTCAALLHWLQAGHLAPDLL